MYCVKCGVRLADTEQVCPLCQTRVYHPDLAQEPVDPLYPSTAQPPKHIKRWSVMLVLTILFLLPICVCLVCDLSLNGAVVWSGYVIGSLLVLYCTVMLPSWFKKPNPVIFTPVAFASICLLLLYICFATGGDWFLPFAFPITGAVCLIVTAVVTLCRYIRKGRLYIYGGAIIAVGLLTVLIEFLLHVTFPLTSVVFWSLYPLISLTLLGLAVISTAIFRPLRESLERKLFI